LKNAGFDPGRIGIVMKDKAATKEVTVDHGTHSTEGAVAGSVVGGTAGAILAAIGALVIPGVGPFISGGILVSLVGGAAGWLVGGLAGLGIPEDEAEYYEEQVGNGKALVTVDAQGRDEEARAILLRDGAEDLQAAGFGTAPTAAVPMATRAQVSSNAMSEVATGDAANVRIPVREEELVAGKRAQEAGVVHVHKDVIVEEQTVSVPLRQERVTVERVPLDNAAAADPDAFQERDIDVPVMGEEAVVGKTVRGVEGVVINKDVFTEDRSVRDTVCKERVTVDDSTRTGAAFADSTTMEADVPGAARNVADKVGSAKDRLTGQ
jgi:uncharacterized protein (TIGR02271 family)